MKKIFITLFLSFSLLNTLNASNHPVVDFHFGLGYGGDILSKKQVFPKDYYNPTGNINIFDGFIGGGYKFMNLGILTLSSGLEYQANYRLTISRLDDLTNEELKVESIALGQAIDHYLSGYIKANWWLTPLVPAGIMATVGLGFRELLEFVVLNAKELDIEILHPDQKLVVGYKMGLRAFISAFYLGMDYTLFPTSYKSTKANNTAQTFSFTGGIMFNL